MKNLKIILTYCILLFINFIFAFKYINRFSEYAFLISSSIIIIQILIIYICNSYKTIFRVQRFINYSALLIITAVAIATSLYIPIEKLNVDRWSVIYTFLEELLSGNYPYFAKSNMGNYPGPMPVYFLIAYPFYILKELSFLSIIGYIGTIWVFRKRENGLTITLLILTSVFMYWEIATRSNIFTFSFLILLGLNYFEKIDVNIFNRKFYISAIITGLLLATRSVFVLVYVTFFLSFLIKEEVKLKPLITYFAVSFLAFILCFIPFIIIFPYDFLKMNPFIVQSSFLIPSQYIFLFILIAAILSFLIKNKSDRYFYSGSVLFISILIYSVFHLIKLGFEAAYINSVIDISYFLFCIPLYFYFLANTKQMSKIN